MVGLAHLPVEVLQNITSRLTTYDIAISLRNCGNSILWAKCQLGGVSTVLISNGLGRSAMYSILPSFSALTTFRLTVPLSPPNHGILTMLNPQLKALILQNQSNLSCWLHQFKEEDLNDPTNHHIHMLGLTPLILSQYYPTLQVLKIEAGTASFRAEWPLGLRIRFLLGLPTSLRRLTVGFKFFHQLDVFRFVPPHLEHLGFDLEGQSTEKFETRPDSFQSSLSSFRIRSHNYDDYDFPLFMPCLASWLSVAKINVQGRAPRNLDKWFSSELESLKLDDTKKSYLLGTDFVSGLPKSLRNLSLSKSSPSENTVWPSQLQSLSINTVMPWNSFHTLPKSLTRLFWTSPAGKDPTALLQSLPPNLVHFVTETPLMVSPMDLSHLKLQYLQLCGNAPSLISAETKYPTTLTFLRLMVDTAYFLNALPPVSDQFLISLPPRLKTLKVPACIRESQLDLLPKATLTDISFSEISYETGDHFGFGSDPKQPEEAFISTDAKYQNGKFVFTTHGYWHLETRIKFTEDSQLKFPRHISSVNLGRVSDTTMIALCIKKVLECDASVNGGGFIRKLVLRSIPAENCVPSGSLLNLTELVVTDGINELEASWLQLPQLRTLNLSDSTLTIETLHSLPVQLTSLEVKQIDGIARHVAHLTNLKRLVLKPEPRLFESQTNQATSYLPASLTEASLSFPMLPREILSLQCLQPAQLGQLPALKTLTLNFVLQLDTVLALSRTVKTLVCSGVQWGGEWTKLLESGDQTTVTIKSTFDYLIGRLRAMIAPMTLTNTFQSGSYTSSERKWTKRELNKLPRNLQSFTADRNDFFCQAHFGWYLPPSLTYLNLLPSSSCNIPSNVPSSLPRHLTTLKCGAKMWCLNAYQSLPPSLTHLELTGAKKFKPTFAKALPSQLLFLIMQVNRYEKECIPALPRSITDLSLFSSVALSLSQMIEVREAYPPNLRRLKLSLNESSLLCFPPGPHPEIFGNYMHDFTDKYFSAQEVFQTPESLVKMPAR